MISVATDLMEPKLKIWVVYGSDTQNNLRLRRPSISLDISYTESHEAGKLRRRPGPRLNAWMSPYY